MTRPSIAELQLATPADAPWQNGATLAILRAAPVLLEIAAAALAYSRPVRNELDAREKEVARVAMLAALAKVRP